MTTPRLASHQLRAPVRVMLKPTLAAGELRVHPCVLPSRPPGPLGWTWASFLSAAPLLFIRTRLFLFCFAVSRVTAGNPKIFFCYPCCRQTASLGLTDPHMGFNRFTNTLPALSRRKWEEYAALMQQTSPIKADGVQQSPAVQQVPAPGPARTLLPSHGGDQPCVTVLSPHWPSLPLSWKVYFISSPLL